MITDVFYKRYPEAWHFGEGVPPEVAQIIRQAAIIMFDDVAPCIPDNAPLFERPDKQLARELGMSALGRYDSARNCAEFLDEPYDLWNDQHGRPEMFVKLRLSLIELLVRQAEEILKNYAAPQANTKGWRAAFKGKSQEPIIDRGLKALDEGVAELNRRFRAARMPFEYHNGIIQRIDDQLTNRQIDAPFWDLVSADKWKNVDVDMKEAFDRRDAGKSDAAFHALRALESTIKIISHDLGRTRGKERGASEFVDKLVAKNPDRYIEVWESDALKALFKDLRNPMGHGAGSSASIQLTAQQTTFVIESAMSWIKSLIRRMP